MREGAPHSDTRPSVAVVGAGMSGLACARALAPHAKVQVFDKSRGVGGRLSTRYAGAYEFDHGAQYFTARDPHFQAFVAEAVTAGVVTPWSSRALYLKADGVEQDRGGERYVGTPRMNALPKWMAKGISVETAARVASITTDGGHTLHFEDGGTQSGFSATVLAIPAPQAALLLPLDFAGREAVETADLAPCFALMVGLDAKHDFDVDTLRVEGLPIDWIAVNSHKPGRPDGATTLMIHASAAWSRAHVDDDRADVEAELLAVASDLLFTDLRDAPHIALHRWLYSSVATPAGQSHLWDPALRIGVCGDWCPGGRVEGAYLSGLTLARTIIDKL